MKTFVDTSAFYALADTTDRHHSVARKIYEELIGKEELITTDYVLLECSLSLITLAEMQP